MSNEFVSEVPLTRGQRAADKVRDALGSWTFIAIQTAFIAIWMLGNGYFIIVHFDKYPFILLNLLFSIQASYSGPIILMSQRRADDLSDELARNTYANTESISQLLKVNNANTKSIAKLLESNTRVTESIKTISTRTAKEVTNAVDASKPKDTKAKKPAK